MFYAAGLLAFFVILVIKTVNFNDFIRNRSEAPSAQYIVYYGTVTP
jgi:hypothetical protein